nr:hypothetical protein [Bradyrhizobium sp. CCBAU 11361]
MSKMRGLDCAASMAFSVAISVEVRTVSGATSLAAQRMAVPGKWPASIPLGDARIIEEAIGRLRRRTRPGRLARCRRHLIKQAAESARQSLVRQPCRNDFVVIPACSTGSRVSAHL